MISTHSHSFNLRTSRPFLEFLQKRNCRISDVLYKVIMREDYLPAYRLMVTTEQINYLGLRKTGLISYLPKGKELSDGKFGWQNPESALGTRQEGKPSKVIKKIFSSTMEKIFTDKDWEDFANAYKAYATMPDFRFELLPSSEIGNIYMTNAATGEGSLNKSCMRQGYNSVNSNYFRMYENCQSLQVLVLRNKMDEICGRALVWNAKTESGDVTFMDRCYVIRDEFYIQFIDYAKEKKWARRYKYCTKDLQELVVMPDERCEMTLQMRVETSTEFQYYPYMDTFSYGGNGWLCNIRTDEAIYQYHNTDGSRDDIYPPEPEEDDDIVMTYDGREIQADEARTITAGRTRYIGRTYHQDDVVYVDGEYYYREDSDYVAEVHGDWYRSDDVCYCIYIEENELMEDCVYSELDGYLLQDDAVEINGDWYYINSNKICTIDGSYYLRDSDDVVYSENHDEYLLKENARYVETEEDWFPEAETVEIDGVVYLEANVPETQV